MLKTTLLSLINLFSIDKVNDCLGEIFEEKRLEAERKNDSKSAQYFDELSEKYDNIRDHLLNRPFRNDQREPK